MFLKGHFPIVGFFVGISLLVGVLLGVDLAARAGAREAVETADLDAKIMAYVVERNPDATIKAFSGFAQVLQEESKAAGIDFRIVLALIDKESGFKPNAVGRSGEIGLMQILPSTAATIAKNKGWRFVGPGVAGKGHLGTLADPKENVKYGLAYLKDQVDRFGMTPTALRAYNRGPAAAPQRRPHDRYAEDVALRLVRLVHEIN